VNFGSSTGATEGSQQSTQSETALSKAQAGLLKQRQAQFNQYIFPEIVSELEKTETVDKAALRQGVQATNRAGEQAESQFTSAIAQRGLEGSGAEVQGLAAIGSARQSALSQDFFAAQQVAKQSKFGLLNLGAGLAPATTTAAPLASSSRGVQESAQKQSGLGTLGISGFDL